MALLDISVGIDARRTNGKVRPALARGIVEDYPARFYGRNALTVFFEDVPGDDHAHHFRRTFSDQAAALIDEPFR